MSQLFWKPQVFVEETLLWEMLVLLQIRQGQDSTFTARKALRFCSSLEKNGLSQIRGGLNVAALQCSYFLSSSVYHV